MIYVNIFSVNRIVSNWNSLPDNVITSNSVGIFVNRLDKFWRDQAYYFDYTAALTGAEKSNVNVNKLFRLCFLRSLSIIDANIEAISLFSLILVSFRFVVHLQNCRPI